MISSEQYLGLDSSALVQPDPLRPQLQCTPGAAAAFKKLVQAAAQSGITLAAASAWRSFDRQYRIFDEKYRGVRPVLNEREEPVDISGLTSAGKIREICRFSAFPGFSRHHFGTDFDIYAPNLLPPGQQLQLCAREYAPGSYFYPLEEWLKHNLHACGFVRPYDGSGSTGYEPWHISFAREAERFVQAFDLREALKLLKSRNPEWYQAAEQYLLDKNAGRS